MFITAAEEGGTGRLIVRTYSLKEERTNQGGLPGLRRAISWKW